MFDIIVAVAAIVLSVAVLVPYYRHKLRVQEDRAWGRFASLASQHFDTWCAWILARDTVIALADENTKLRLEAQASATELSTTEQTLLSHVADRLDASNYEQELPVTDEDVQYWEYPPAPGSPEDIASRLAEKRALYVVSDVSEPEPILQYTCKDELDKALEPYAEWGIIRGFN